MNDIQIRKKNLLYFPLGTVGRDMVYCLVTNYLLTFILFTRSLTNSQLAAVTAIMVGARIFDGLNDPIMGNIIERTRTKWGKFKPWLLAGTLSSSVLIYMVFSTKLQGWNFIWLFGLFYFGYSITFTMCDISYWGMVPALSSNADARNQFTARATLFAGIGSTTASILIPMLTTGTMALGGSTATAYSIIALIIGVLSPLFVVFTLVGVREHREDMKEAAPPISFRKIVKTISGNDQLMWISLAFLIQQVSNGIIIGGLGSTYIYVEFGYEGGLYSLFTTIGMMATAFLMVFYPAISRRIKRKDLMKIMIAISMAGYAAMIACALLPAGNFRFWVLVIGYMLSNFGQYCFYLIMMISIINTVEYNELKTGSRDEAIIASLRPFITKVGSAITAIIVSGTYMIFRITSFTNRVSELENMAAAGTITETEKMSQIGTVLGEVHHSQALGLLIVMTVVPAVLMIISHIIYRKHYKLDEEEYERICREIEERKQA
ncbi:MAG: MFS transporter [Oscillospiraceae bacterium]|nr:MFS transporter [Oscillospiraceae bacterium]